MLAKVWEDEVFIWLKFLLGLVWGLAVNGHAKENGAMVEIRD